ncbi:Gfo/Idh/MocA family protein [Agromyces sp. C10]|uniref:Gfo/Idh/MocA family protein n=1 Tax=Agromyces sp. C10 TaxID=2935077 RepID=UPI00200B5C67|nr:Gfo/Idh/MocA family oxidoreductase [Agromyces sp. C10]MCK8610063.1 Gfo/Idh/MocA family oxidoreductase [Agromyces sp. C10]
MPRRVAVLGMGRWGRTWCRVLDGEPDVDVVTVAVRPGGTTVDLPDVHVVDDLGSALDVDGLDAAIVTLPVGLHLDAIRAAVSRGVPVLCEKPAVATRSELSELEQLAGDGAVVRINQNYRLRPWAESVRAHLPSIGRLLRVEVAFAQPEFPDGGRDRLAHPLLADMAIHHVDLLRHLTGREANVVRASAARRPDTSYAGSTDLEAELLLDGGAQVAYDGTWAARGTITPWDGDWVFVGDRGTLTVRDLAVDVDAGDGPRRVATTLPPAADEDLAVAWRDFVRAVDGDDAAGVTTADNSRSLAVVFELAEAAGVPDPSAVLDSHR